jgi:hypothetical protein
MAGVTYKTATRKQDKQMANLVLKLTSSTTRITRGSLCVFFMRVHIFRLVALHTSGRDTIRLFHCNHSAI